MATTSKSFELPTYIKFCIKTLERIHPYLATKFALKLFFTPLKFPVPQMEMAVRDKADTYTLSINGKSFKAFEWPGSGPKILLCHGWSGRGSQFSELIELLLLNGYHIVTFDAPGHGNNEHQKTDLQDFIDCIETCTNKFGPFKAAIGHSLGGQAITNSFAASKPQIPLILIATPASVRNTIVSFCNILGAGKEVCNGIIRNIERTYDLKIDEFSAKHLLHLYNPVGLIIHDDKDIDVPYSNAIELSQSWKSAALISTSNLGHRRVLRDSAVLKEIITFLEINVV